MNFNDIFKSSFLENMKSISLLDMAVALVLAFLLGMFIFLVYKKTFSGVMYSSSFGVTLVALTMISTLVILAVTSNVVLSLGMVGALSIVRFRTAVKDPADTAYLFWAVAAGITAGAGFYLLTLIGCVVAGLICLLSVQYMDRVDKPFLLVLRAQTNAALEAAEKVLEEEKLRYQLSSCVDTGSYTEAVYELGVSPEGRKKVAALKELPGMLTVSLVDCRKEG